jgi:hypothetical protein
LDAHHWWKIRRGWGGYGLAAALGIALLAFGLALPPLPVAADTFNPVTAVCPTGTYIVPDGTSYVQIVAIGGTGAGGSSVNDTNHGGHPGTGAKVTAILPVTPGQVLGATVGHNGGISPNAPGFPNGGPSPNGEGGGSSFVTSGSTFACPQNTSNNANFGVVDRSAILVVAGGGGGGGGAMTAGSGGNGGNAGTSADGSGQNGSDAYDVGCDTGHGGGGGTPTSAGNGGSSGCASTSDGVGGGGVSGGDGGSYANTALQAGGGGGGGWYGGGGGGAGGGFALGGGGGGGAGSSHVDSSAVSKIITQDTSINGSPSVTITPYQPPNTTAALSGTTSGNAWYTSVPTVTLNPTSDQALGAGVLATYYALDNAACNASSPSNLAQCHTYSIGSPFNVSSILGANTQGLHTLTFFSVDTNNVVEAVETQTFAVTLTSAPVSNANINSGNSPTATTGGATGVTVSGSGSGTVGAAVYGSDPAGTVTSFNGSGAYVDVIVAGSGLTSVTITDCNLNGGTNVYWWNGTAWALVNPQSYNQSTKCVTFTVNSSSSPTLSQLTGTPLSGGSPPSITATATTPTGTYTGGTWTNQSVTVKFTCSANATASANGTSSGTSSATATVTTEGGDQSVAGACTDGLGEKTPTTFIHIDIDKTPPTCAVTVSPTTLWPPNGKPIAITGTITVGDDRSGLASVVGSAVTSNETLASGEVQGFTVNKTYSAPLKLSDSVSITGQLAATRAGSGSGRTYTQTITVKDQAGNTNAKPCTWTVSVPHDQGGGQGGPSH